MSGENPLKISRRQLFRMSGAGMLVAAYASVRADAADTRPTSAGLEFPVRIRRILIPAPGETIPALLARPAVGGKYPAIVLQSSGSVRDHEQLCRIAAKGFLVVAPLRGLSAETGLPAMLAYLRAHPGAESGPQVIHC
jgi:hypothetical protein